MKGVPIKFRGKSVKTGEYVYGYFGRSNSGKALIVNMDATKATIVEEESVAQLVGYDEKDKEVYEGDSLVNLTGIEFKASLKCLITSIKNPSYSRYLENLKDRQYYRLKG